MQAPTPELTRCDAKVMSTRTTAGQLKGQFKGAMEEILQSWPLRWLRHRRHRPASHEQQAVSSAGRWKIVQRMFKCKRSQHTAHKAAYSQFSGAMDESSWKRCRARDVESSATLPTMSTRNVPAGRWKKCLGKGRRRAYRTSRVVMDIAAFKVGHSVRSDKDATALQAARAGSQAS
eukprot:scaffold8060_cov82-Phaeocystis_antarctica.AAC.2